MVPKGAPRVTPIFFYNFNPLSDPSLMLQVLDKKAISLSTLLLSLQLSPSQNMSWYEFLVNCSILLADESTTPGCRGL